MEKAEWKLFRSALDKMERKEFDDMFDIPKLYISACSNSVQLVALHPIIISILFHHYKDLTRCMSEVEHLEEQEEEEVNSTSSSGNKQWLTKDQEQEEMPTRLDNYFYKEKELMDSLTSMQQEQLNKNTTTTKTTTLSSRALLE
jgi:hypothetical protein